MADLESESVAIPRRLIDLPWEAGEREALDTLRKLEGRRAGMPYLLKQARRQEAEAELHLLDIQLAEAEARRPELEAQVEEKRVEFESARRALNHAKGEHSELVYGVMSDIRRAQHAAKERLMKAESEDITGERRGPVVRSMWQQTQQAPGEENAIQHTPGALRFGSANVSDVPVSMEEDQAAATVVIPDGARKGRGVS